MLIVLLLLISLKSWSQSKPFMGDLIISDTVVSVSIDYIKKANAKMIERKYLIDINKQQDSIILLKDKYIKEQSIIINDFKQKIIAANDLNKSITNSLNKQIRYNLIMLSVGGGIILGLITMLSTK